MSSATSRVTCLDRAELHTATSTSASPTRSALPCRRSEDPDLWFAERPDQLEQAKALCGPCPIRERCLRAALDREEPWGVWGGEILDQGTVITRKRPRGRPRKVCA
jgi:WhiB family transcriptional regulator, redox-sensing transcriptional regulator